MSVKYDAYFTKASETYGVDKNLLIAIAQTESGINANSTSNAGAMGVMQLMPGTASLMGVQNAYDPEQNIMGGAKYFAQMLQTFNGDVELALSAYNAGPTRVKQSGTVLSFTQDYVDKVLSKLKNVDKLNNNPNSTPTVPTYVRNTVGNGLVWWGDLIRVIVILLCIILGVVTFSLAVTSGGVVEKVGEIVNGVK